MAHREQAKTVVSQSHSPRNRLLVIASHIDERHIGVVGGLSKLVVVSEKIVESGDDIHAS